eukprot:Seg5293.2 transcript_id=Seg5293.2/GoldUCD/mRNA.D3Y31 product="hypothetical protein" protein_id=Seg5293.2/GoldUCD/D3Y31
MAFLSAIGDWLEGSGWADILVKAEISTPGRADSFLSGRNVKRSRYANQITCAGLHLLCMDAYQRSQCNRPFQEWIEQKRSESVQFKYWLTGMDMESILLLLVQSLRASNFQMFVSALEQIVPWMFSLDHTNYARWLPVFKSDLKQLAAKHPFIHAEFMKGHFTFTKSSRKFSSLAEDQQACKDRRWSYRHT